MSQHRLAAIHHTNNDGGLSAAPIHRIAVYPHVPAARCTAAEIVCTSRQKDYFSQRQIRCPTISSNGMSCMSLSCYPPKSLIIPPRHFVSRLSLVATWLIFIARLPVLRSITPSAYIRPSLPPNYAPILAVVYTAPAGSDQLRATSGQLIVTHHNKDRCANDRYFRKLR